MEDERRLWRDRRPVVVVEMADGVPRPPGRRPGWRHLLAVSLIVLVVAVAAGMLRDPAPPIGEQRQVAVAAVERLIEAINNGDFDAYRSIMPAQLLVRDGRQLAMCDTAGCAAAEPDDAAIESAQDQMAFWFTMGSRWDLGVCDSGPSTAGGVWVTCAATFDSPIHRATGETVETNPTLWFRFEEHGEMVLAGPILDRHSLPTDWLLERFPPVQHGDGARTGPCGLLPWAAQLDAACAVWMLDEIAALS